MTPTIVSLAMGRIFRLLSRPTQPGDEAEYERCRRIIMDASDPDYTPYEPVISWARDRLKGAQGQ